PRNRYDERGHSNEPLADKAASRERMADNGASTPNGRTPEGGPTAGKGDAGRRGASTYRNEPGLGGGPPASGRLPALGRCPGRSPYAKTERRTRLDGARYRSRSNADPGAYEPGAPGGGGQ